MVVEQRGISDYALLKREAGNAGLFISEERDSKGNIGKVVIKSITQIKDTSVLLQVGDNLLKWSCRDRAIDADDTVPSDPLLTQEIKGAIDPLTGKLRQVVPDIDSAKSPTTVTGKTPAKVEPKAVTVPGQEVLAQQQQQRTKRVKGLPSTFVVVQQPRIMELVPLSGIRTKGLSKFLDRVWLLDKITHSTDGTSTLECFSPVDVLDLEPEASSVTSANTPLAGLSAKPGKFIVPCDGLVTSIVGARDLGFGSKNHQGIDIGSYGGKNVPIVASMDGTVSRASAFGGYGNCIDISHAGGWLTRYAHLSRYDVRLNDRVSRGQQIGLMGTTGNSSGVHLHFEVRNEKGTALNAQAAGLGSIGSIGAKAKLGQDF